MALEVIASISCNGKPIALHNCTRLRIVSCEARCTMFGRLSERQCASCRVRDPILSMPRSGSTAKPVRGLGDVVESCIRWAFLGRLDVAHRLAALVERSFPTRRRPDPVQRKRGCGCAARKAALNAALPLR